MVELLFWLILGACCAGLEFLPTSEDSAACRGFSDASVVSISVDHQVSEAIKNKKIIKTKDY